MAMRLSVVASGSGLLPWLRPLAAPWYGAIGRTYLIAAPLVVLLGSLTLAELLRVKGRAPRRAGSMALVAVVRLSLLAIPASQLVPMRRQALRATLAGAGDTPAVAGRLASLLAPGETVLNFEGDGGALLSPSAPSRSSRPWPRRTPLDSRGHPYSVAIRGPSRVTTPRILKSHRTWGIARTSPIESPDLGFSGDGQSDSLIPSRGGKWLSEQ
jgi:hypothetical protein